MHADTQAPRHDPIGITHYSAYLPPKRVSVQTWGKMTGLPRQLVSAMQRNGVGFYHDGEGQSVLDMAEIAIRRLFKDAQADPLSIDLLVHVHTLQHSVLPAPASLAAAVARKTGIARALCFSISQQNCVSLIAALRLVRNMMWADRRLQRAVIVGADRMPFNTGRMIDDNGIHSDGSGALLVERGATRNVVSSISHLSIGSVYRGVGSEEERRFSSIYYVNTLKVIRNTVERAGYGLDDLSVVLPHNLNLPGWRRIMAGLCLPEDRLFSRHFTESGHLFTADAMLNLSTCNRVEKGRPFLIYSNGFGGFSGAAVLVA